MGTVLDLDKRRSERNDKPKKAKLDGDTWNLPARLPVTVSQDLATGNVRGAIAGTFGWETAEKAKADALAKGKSKAIAQRLAAAASSEVVQRLAPLLDADLLDTVFAELYDLGEKPTGDQGGAAAE